MDDSSRSENEAVSPDLCELCQILDLRPEKFKISQDTDLGNAPSRRTERPARTIQVVSGRKPLRRKIRDLESRDCPLCSLINDALQLYSNDEFKPEDVRDGECLIEWDLDGPHVESPEDYVNDSRRLKISWTRRVTVEGYPNSVNKEEEVYFAHVPSEAQDTATRANGSYGPGRLFQALPATWDRGHYPQSETLILRWLDMCEKGHKRVHPLSRGDWQNRFSALVQGTSMGVIDVLEKKLCPLPMEDGKRARFVALSYVWGANAQEKHKPLWTTRQNVISRLEKNGLAEDWEKFPRTIRDAIRLVRDLGERIEEQDPSAQSLRYIWIDLLCIVQDSRRSWKTNADSMALIYGNAYFTICAADGDSSDAGLLALDPESRDRPFRKEIMPDLQLLVSKASESIIEASEWNHRAWTFQERILSWRCVVFAGKRVYFQCRQTNLSQDDNLDLTGNGMSSAWRISPLRTLSQLEHTPIRFYMTSVESYTGRNLSHPEDILNAFNGVTQLMEEYLATEFHFGLPASHFDLAMLWKPRAGKLRRKPSNLNSHHGGDFISPAGNQGQETKEGTENAHWGDAEFPSWSWSGWMDSDNPGKGAGVSYDPNFLDGCLTNLRDWLLHHTWIIWHIRDNNGDVRRLWQGAGATVIDEPPRTRWLRGCARWQGYKSKGRKGTDWVKYLEADEHRAGPDDDAYGRPLNSSGRRHVKGPQTSFRELLPDNPFGVRGPEADDTRSYMFFGDNGSMAFRNVEPEQSRPFQPILEFWTLRCDLYVVRDGDAAAPGKDLQKFHVVHGRGGCGDRCGFVVVDKVWAKNNKVDGAECSFIALSEAKSFSSEEWAGWTHYIPGSPEDSEWCLFYVMLIVKDPNRLVWERVGLGKVFQAAFRNNSCVWEEILLG